MKKLLPIHRLPGPIRVLFLIFFTVPLLLLTGRLAPPGTVSRAVQLAAYWGVPWALCYALLFRPYAFLLLYLVECGLLAAATWTGMRWHWQYSLLSGVCIVLNTWAGLAFGNKRLFYPIFSRRQRFWRLHPRIEIHLPVYLTDAAHTKEVPASMVDCSEGGMGLEVPMTAPIGVAARLAVDTRIVVSVRWRGVEFAIPVVVAWCRDTSEARKFGVRALDGDKMKALMNGVRESFNEGVSRNASPSRALRPGGIPLLALIIWSLLLPFMLALPRLLGR